MVCLSKRLSSTNFTWYVLEYLDPNVFIQVIRVSSRNRLQISVLLLSEFKRINQLLFPRNYQKAHGFLMILEEIKVNLFT